MADSWWNVRLVLKCAYKAAFKIGLAPHFRHELTNICFEMCSNGISYIAKNLRMTTNISPSSNIHYK